MILRDWSRLCRASLWKLDGVAGARFESAQTGVMGTTEQRNVTIGARRVLQAFEGVSRQAERCDCAIPGAIDGAGGRFVVGRASEGW